jgi:hypothetical protein
MRFLRRNDELRRLERELRVLRSDPPAGFVRRLAERTGSGPSWFQPRARYVLVGVLTAAVLAASASANVIGLTTASTHNVVNVLKHLTLTKKTKHVYGGDHHNPPPSDDQYAGQCGLPPRPKCVVEVEPDSVYIKEGNSGTKDVTFTLTLEGNRKADGSFSIGFTLIDGSATLADNDYGSPTSGTVTFPFGTKTKTVTIHIVGDTKIEADESFKVKWTPSGPGAVMDSDDVYSDVKILNDDKPAKVTVTPDDPTVKEGNSGTTAVTFTVKLDTPSDGNVHITYQTSDGSAKTSNNDYQSASGTLDFTAGQTTKTVTVNVVGDTTKEADETFKITWTSTTPDATIDSNNGSDTITIQNDDWH